MAMKKNCCMFLKEGTLLMCFLTLPIGTFAQETKSTKDVQKKNKKDTVKAIEEVVMVGYGVQKKATLTGAVTSVKGSTIKTPGMNNVSNTLAGRMAGVIANTRTGEPGNDRSKILIRGMGTINNNDLGNNLPLIVVDGVAERSAGWDRINPNDIESITVLKDASAAIYGARAANGVILITTKRGVSGKPTITYDGSYSFSEFTRVPKLMNAYEYMNWADEIEIAGGRTPVYQQIKGGYLDGTIDRLQYTDTDWMKTTFSRFSPQTRHSLSVRGGSENVRYYLSGDYFYQVPQFKNTVFDFETQQLRSNIDAKITKDLSVNLDIGVRKEFRNNNVVTTQTMFWEALNLYPFLPDYYPNGLPGPGIAGKNLALFAKGSDVGYDRTNDFFLNTKLGFDFKMPWITKGLSLSGFAAVDENYMTRKRLYKVWDTYTYNPITGNYDKRTGNIEGNDIYLDQESYNNNARTLNLKLNYERKFGENAINAFVSYEQYKYYAEKMTAYRRGFLSDFPDYLNFGGDVDKTNTGTATNTSRQNYFGRVNYSFQNKYMAEFTLRYDGSMNFPKNSRWGLFPGVSVGWRISEEKFLKESLPFVNELKLRASWGKLGNDRIPQFQFLNAYTIINGAILGENPALYNGISANITGNPFITWEVAESRNIALEGNLWNNLLSFTAEYFMQTRNNILTKRNASVPTYTGLTLPNENIGKVNNKGFEVTLNHENTIGEFKYSLGGNFTYVKNTILFFDEASNIPEWQRQTGRSMETWLMFKADGIYKNMEEINNSPHLPNTKPGDIKFIDIDGDNTITDNDRIRSKYGNTPRIVYGINMGMEWKNFQINMLWQGQAQVEQMINGAGLHLNNYKELYDGRFISETATPNPRYPRAFNGNQDTNIAKNSTFWLQDTSFLRLRNVQLAYNFPRSLLEEMKINNLRVYITGTNLFSIDKVKFQDPEADSSTAGQNYPQLRTYTLGLSFSF